MAAFCHFWRLSPAEFWALPRLEHEVMSRYMDEWFAEQERQMSSTR